MSWLPNIRFGTEGYPEKVARRLRGFNIAVWIAALIPAGMAIVRFIDAAGFTSDAYENDPPS